MGLFHRYRGKEPPAQTKFDQDPEDQATTEQLCNREQAADPNVGTVLHLGAQRRGKEPGH